MSSPSKADDNDYGPSSSHHHHHNDNKKDTLDAWVIFEHLYKAQRKDIRDYLIHELYFLCDDDIDFFLPQLCSLLVVRDDALSKQLECFMLHKCMTSIDFALKCFWNFHAIQFYSETEAQRTRCDGMRQNLEMIVVNGQLPRNLLQQLPSDIRSELENGARTPSSHRNGNSSNSNSKSIVNASNGHEDTTPSLSLALPKPKKPEHVKESENVLNGATEYLKKQRRCTYFNAELDFAHFLEGVSSALEQCEAEDRTRLLEENIRYANKCLPRGLYIPIAHSASEPHKSLLRIVPSEAKCLDSKQKVPFLLFCEVEQHSYPVSSSQICEELTESDSALLQSSGLYVLIDEHKKRRQNGGGSHHHHGTLKKKDRHNGSSSEKKPHPNKLQAKIRKPSRKRLSLSAKSKSQIITKSKSMPSRNGHGHGHGHGHPQPDSEKSTPSPPLSTEDNSEHCVTRNAYSEDDADDGNGDNDNDDDDEEEEESKQSGTHSLVKHNLVSLASIPSPMPRPRDEEADRNMERHLKTIVRFEPLNKKAAKHNHNDNGHNGYSDDRDAVQGLARVVAASQSSSALMVSPESNGHLASSSTAHKLRSRTPEPDKLRGTMVRKRSRPSYQSKSDGDSNDEKAQQTAVADADNDADADADDAEAEADVDVDADVDAIATATATQTRTHSQAAAHSSKSKSKSQSQSPTEQKTGDILIYRHPHYAEQKRNKLQYVRGRSMSWKDPFGEAWQKRMARYQQQSPFVEHEHWSMQSVIFKSGEDMRQEQLAMQFIRLFDGIWCEAKLPLQLRPYSVIVTSPASGFVETVPNSVSISRLKHAVTNFVSLRKFFEQFYGPVGSPGFELAQKNFVESMAAYCLVCYLLQIKDRHNGNILLTAEGRVVHIDFDFLFSNSPGGNIGFESAPFKLTEEYIQVMGGEENSKMFNYFKILLIRGFLEARKHVRKFVLMARIMLEGAPMPCFLAGKQVISQLQQRFATKLTSEKCIEHVHNLIEESACNWRSVQYDKFQRITNNIL
eukprot:CAMPEP_0202688812 /NCGR_PEP_ID=MMETSP1385-20130828/4234_1 /ASSEMBLY_ACC=CAM_ASM_000861 /TAXON_ID=933848 /ORGANISM="Elphidium margaritaceum" /LENGTH=1014 /DNA_ID=CAMNT_0049343857 /DNA_START=87 /DNA_END=3131 /DNA_ORIENTATION=-